MTDGHVEIVIDEALVRIVDERPGEARRKHAIDHVTLCAGKSVGGGAEPASLRQHACQLRARTAPPVALDHRQQSVAKPGALLGVEDPAIVAREGRHRQLDDSLLRRRRLELRVDVAGEPRLVGVIGVGVVVIPAATAAAVVDRRVAPHSVRLERRGEPPERLCLVATGAECDGLIRWIDRADDGLECPLQAPNQLHEVGVIVGPCERLVPHIASVLGSRTELREPVGM